MIAAIHQPQFLPYLGFFHKVRHSDVLVVLDDVQFQKHGFQNRNLIKTATGGQWLTVPVQHHLGQRICDVAVGQTSNWRKKHWSSIQANYGRARFFELYAADLRGRFLGRDDTQLLSVDLDLMRWAMAALGVDVPVRLSSELDVVGGRTERLVGICRAVGADTYISGPGGRAYMDLSLFEDAGIAVQFQEYAAREYSQLFPQQGFLPSLAVVDALFNVGPDASQLIA